MESRRKRLKKDSPVFCRTDEGKYGATLWRVENTPGLFEINWYIWQGERVEQVEQARHFWASDYLENIVHRSIQYSIYFTT